MTGIDTDYLLLLTRETAWALGLDGRFRDYVIFIDTTKPYTIPQYPHDLEIRTHKGKSLYCHPECAVQNSIVKTKNQALGMIRVCE
jgi:hypothetical protein